MPLQKIRTGVTAINTFSECRKKWYYETVKRLRPASYNHYMEVGSLVHAFLEGYYSSVKCGPSASPQEHEAVGNEFLENYIVKRQTTLQEVYWQQFDEDIKLAEQLIQNYLWYQDVIFFKRVIDVESFHTLKDFGDTGVDIAGKLDMLVELEDGRIALVDHKVKGNSGSEDELVLPMDSQLNVYAMLVADKYGFVPDVLIHNILLRKVYTGPTILKSGKVSTARTVLDGTTFGKYRDAIVQQGLRLADYKEQLDYLANKSYKKFFNRIEIPIDRAILEASYDELEIKASAMKDAVENDTCYRNNHVYNCKRCIYATVCMADMRGENSEIAMQLLFEREK